MAFKSHLMYSPKLGKSVRANTEKKHLQLKSRGYSHKKPKGK